MKSVEPRNAAGRVMAELLHRLNSSEPADITDALVEGLASDSYVRNDRRPLVGTPDLDGDGQQAALRAYHEVGQGRPTYSISECIAEHGADVALVRIVTRFESGFSSESLHILVLDAAGSIVRMIVFDPDQQPEAVAEFEELAADTSS